MNGLKAAALQARLTKMFPWAQDYEVSWELGKTWAHTVRIEDTRNDQFVTLSSGDEGEVAAAVSTVKGWRKPNAK